MADLGQLHGERVYCHECRHEWDRAHGGLTCPACGGDFTEIRETSIPPTPSARPEAPDYLSSASFLNRNAWQDEPPDPGEDDITTYRFNTAGGRGGTFTFTSHTYTRGGRHVRSNVMADPEDPALMNTVDNFEHLLTGLLPPQIARNRPVPMTGQFSPLPDNAFPNARQRRVGGYGIGTFVASDAPEPVAVGTGNMQEYEDEAGPFVLVDADGNSLFSMLFQSINEVGGAPHHVPGQPPNPFMLLSGLFNNGRHGDAVFSQEALDQVITQLMEQNQGSTAPGPASQDAINNLPTKSVDQEMLGDEGTAECSICMENVGRGEDVTVLPCKHWFHGACVTAWLKEHDTCPHCRKSISNTEEREPAPGPRRRSSRRPSSVASPRSPAAEGSRRNPFAAPDSPRQIREARQQYYSGSSQDRPDDSRPYAHRRVSSHSDVQARAASGSGSSGGGSGGGVSGWLRNHLPFSG